MRFVTTRTIAAVFVVGLLAACESSSSGSTPTTAASESATTEAAPLHAIPVDAVGVTGTAVCSFSNDGVTPEGDPGGTRVSCELEMSDPRVSGTEVSDRYRFYEREDIEEPDAVMWVAEEVVLTNGEGTWRGITQAADDARPCGESHYVGEGAYAGLEFHYYFCDGVGDGPAELRGWISGGG